MLRTVTSIEEAEHRSRFSGHLYQFYRFGPFGKLSGWRKQFVCLAPSGDNTDTQAAAHTASDSQLSLFFFTPDGTGATTGVRFRAELALEQGCEARENFDASTGREHTFLVITSKQQLRLQATSADARERWVAALSTEFEKQVGTSLLEQKTELLRRGSQAFTWHHPSGGGQVLEGQRLVCVGSSPTMLQLGDVNSGTGRSVPFSDVESVEAGNFHASSGSTIKQAFHFNCLVIRLKQPAGSTLDLECDKQSTRDDWVSALGAFLDGGEVPRLRGAGDSFRQQQQQQQAVAAAAASVTLKPAGGGGGKKNTLDGNGNSSNINAEFFKQKYAMRSDFPYSACISRALEFALGQPGSSTAVPSASAQPVAVTREDMDLVLTHPKFRVHDDAASSKKANLYELTEFAPRAFRELRHKWGVSDAQLAQSMAQLSGDGAVGDGKSGMLFFFTRDRRFVLKTVKPNEMQVLQGDFLRAYVRHMLDYADSLLCRFFGLYTFRFPGQQPISLVCMQNSFDTRLVLHEKYDLKGSTRNRWCTPRFGAVLKDLNFGTSRLYLDAADRLALLEQCDKDTQMLEQFNVMDYSLLLGTHKAAPDEHGGRRNLVLLAMANQLEDSSTSTGPPRANRWQRDFGGVEGWNPHTQAPEVYIMCVIDLLQAYDLGKKAENLIKSQMTEVVSEISSVNPRTYRARFLAYLAKIIVGTVGQNAHIQAQRREIKLKVFANAGGRPTTLPRGGGGAAPSLVKPMLPRRASAMTETPARVQPAVASSASSLRRSFSAPQEPTTAAAGSAGAGHLLLQSLLDQDDQLEAGSLDEDQLKTEIQRAVLEAEQSKKQQAGGGGGYTEVLEDGTEITILDSGGFIQRSPSTGITIHMFADGSKRQTDPDGSTIDVSAAGEITCHLPDGTEIVHVLADDDDDGSSVNVVDLQRNPDGSTIETWRDGTQIQRNADLSRIETYTNGDKRTFFPDGVVVEQMSSGAVRQINPDGITILSMTNGHRIQTDSNNPHQILTTFPDGGMLQEDKSDGMVIRTFADLSELHTFPDGTVIEYRQHHADGAAGGYSKQTNVDGTVIETFADGKVVQTSKDGTRVEM